MAEGNRAHRRLAAAPGRALLAGPGLPVGPAAPSGNGAGLDEGPTRWLMLPDEARQYRRLQTTREVVDFVEAFWRRRDPDPDKPGNEFAKTFYERVEAADRLYSEGGTRGSLTDRGRALVLLGPPPVLRYGQKKVPAWDPGRRAAPPPSRPTRCRWRPGSTPSGSSPRPSSRSSSRTTPSRRSCSSSPPKPSGPSLIDGEKFLEMAARAAVLR